jgi:predicted naringenin-chalcone synthase
MQGKDQQAAAFYRAIHESASAPPQDAKRVVQIWTTPDGVLRIWFSADVPETMKKAVLRAIEGVD